MTMRHFKWCYVNLVLLLCPVVAAALASVHVGRMQLLLCVLTREACCAGRLMCRR
jgi:hypothetical protein